MPEDTIAINVPPSTENTTVGINTCSVHAIKATAVLSSAAAATYYAVTTENQSWPVIVSGVGANFFVGIFAAYHSINYVISLKNLASENKNYKTVIASIIIALGLSVPYGLITYAEYATPNLTKKLLASFLSVLGSLVINGLALQQFQDELSNMKAFFIMNSIHKNIADNLKTVLQMLSVSAPNGIPLSELSELEFDISSTEKALCALNIIFNYADSAPKPTVVNLSAWLAPFVSCFEKLIQLIFIVAPFYSAIAVACAADVSLQNDLHVSKITGVIGGNILMLGEYFLSATGGLALSSAVLDVMTVLFKYKKIPNYLTQQLLCTMMFAVIIASLSGYTAEKQLEQCPSSYMGEFMLFPNPQVSAKTANGSSAFFNAIYVGKCLMAILKNVGKEKQTTHGVLLKAISDIQLSVVEEHANKSDVLSETVQMAKKLVKSPSHFNISLFPAVNNQTETQSTYSMKKKEDGDSDNDENDPLLKQ